MEESKKQREDIKNLKKEKAELTKKLEESERQRADLEQLLQIKMEQYQSSLNQHTEQIKRQCRLVEALQNQTECYQGYFREYEGMLWIDFYHCAVPDKIQTWDRGIGDRWNFKIYHFTFLSSRLNKSSPTGISDTKNQDPWKSQMIFSWSPLEIPLLFYWPLEFLHSIFSIPLEIRCPQPLPPPSLFGFFWDSSLLKIRVH